MIIDHEDVKSGASTGTRLSARPEVRWFAIGELVMMVLSQMWFVTLSWWLVSSRGAGAAVGGVLAVGAIPRAVCMLLGGAVSDRYSPAAVLRATAAGRVVLLGAAIVVATGESPMWQLYVVSALFGAIDGFGFPAVTATLPMLASGAGLARLNAFVLMSDQVAQIASPAAAAILLARSGTRSALTAAAVLALLACAAYAQLARRLRRVHAPNRRKSSISREIAAGVRYSWGRRDLRAYLLVVAGLGLGTVGPMTLGSALLADQHFGGAGSLGWLLAAFGVGALIGTLIAGARPPTTSPKRILVVLCLAIAVGMAGLALAPTLPIAVGIAGLTAMSWGYEGVITATWLQSTTDPAFQGRVSSLLAFSFLALDPVSQALTGALSAYGPGTAFLAGAALVGVVGVLVSITRWPEAP